MSPSFMLSLVQQVSECGSALKGQSSIFGGRLRLIAVCGRFLVLGGWLWLRKVKRKSIKYPWRLPSSRVRRILSVVKFNIAPRLRKVFRLGLSVDKRYSPLVIIKIEGSSGRWCCETVQLGIWYPLDWEIY